MTNKIETSWAKEQRKLALCRKLVVSQRYSSQEEIRHQMMRSGYQGISQSTVSRLLKILGVMKVQNAKGKKSIPSMRCTTRPLVSASLCQPC